MMGFDYQKPSYSKVFQDRAKRLEKIRGDSNYLPQLRAFYKNNPASFITDWGCTTAPRNLEIGKPAFIPFLLFDKQVEWVDWVFKLWSNRDSGVTEKSRQMGVSWLSVALAVTLCIFNDNMIIGFGSRKEVYVDKKGDPKSIFHKIRSFIDGIPKEFRAGYEEKINATHLKVSFPFTNSVISGEAGDGIGRGAEYNIYFVDEAAFIERPAISDASLSSSTNCRIDISTPNGTNNSFYEKVKGGENSVFTFHWRDDPRRDDEWYQKQVLKINDPVIIAQELDLNYSASTEGVVIPSSWVQSAIDSHLKLGISPTGLRLSALDVADEGRDLNALCTRHGVLVSRIESWSGKNSDIYSTVEKAMSKCAISGSSELIYDADGLGAGVKGDAKRITANGLNGVLVKPFRGSAKVHDPRGQIVYKRFNEDFFANAKAQAWWSLKLRFLETYRAVVEGLNYDESKIISISKESGEHMKLATELSQPTFTINSAGKIIIDKTPSGGRSPNLADSVMMAFAPRKIGYLNAPF